MRIYQLPICMRQIKAGRLAQRSVNSICADIGGGLGAFIYFSNNNGGEDLVSIDLANVVIKNGKMLIKAKECKSAIEMFHDYEGTKIGGEILESRALWLNKNKPIIEFPYCSMLCIHEDNRFTCGELMEDNEGEFGECVVKTSTKHKTSLDCIFLSFRENLRKDYDDYCESADEVLGYRVIRSKQIPIELT